MATERQKRLVKEVVENSRSVSAAMRKVGYSAKTATHPKQVTQSKGWAELMEQHFPDKKLAKVHEEGLKATRIEGKMLVEDYAVRHKYLDTAYRLKGSYSPEKKQVEVRDLSNYDNETLSKLAGLEEKSDGGISEEGTGEEEIA